MRIIMEILKQVTKEKKTNIKRTRMKNRERERIKQKRRKRVRLTPSIALRTFPQDPPVKLLHGRRNPICVSFS